MYKIKLAKDLVKGDIIVYKSRKMMLQDDYKQCSSAGSLNFGEYWIINILECKPPRSNIYSLWTFENCPFVVCEQ